MQQFGLITTIYFLNPSGAGFESFSFYDPVCFTELLEKLSLEKDLTRNKWQVIGCTFRLSLYHRSKNTFHMEKRLQYRSLQFF